jgi:hypothetical protein
LLQQRAHPLFLALALLEVDQRNAVASREALDALYVLLSDLPERGRGWDTEASLPAEKRAYLSH